MYMQIIHFEMMVELRNNGYYASGVHFNNSSYSIFNNNIQLNGVEKFHSQFLALPSGWWVNGIKIN